MRLNDAKVLNVPFCHEGVGHALAVLPPPPRLLTLDLPEEGEMTVPTGATVLRGALAATASGTERML